MPYSWDTLELVLLWALHILNNLLILFLFLFLWPTFKHSDSSGGWEQTTKLSKNATLKFINTTLTIVTTAIKSILLKLGI